MGCSCSVQLCSAIGPSGSNGCSFSPSAFNSDFSVEIACGSLPAAATWFNISTSNNSIGCGDGLVVDCLWSGGESGVQVTGVSYNFATNECELQPTSAVGAAAICLKRTSTWNVKPALTNVVTCLPAERVLGCQCSQDRASPCEAMNVTNNTCFSNGQKALGFCVEELGPTPPPPTTATPTPGVLFLGCPLILPSYLEREPTCKFTDLLPEKETCELRCRDGKQHINYFVASSVSASCVNQSLILPYLGCPEGVEVHFEVELESISCGLDIDNATIRVGITEGLLSVARTALGFSPDYPKVLSTASFNSSFIKCDVWFDVPRDAASFSKWASVHNTTRSFNVTSVFEEHCEVVVIIRNVTLFFESLFTFLSDLPSWVLFLCLALLVVAVFVFLFVNRTSDHPFAVLGAIVSIINVASKAVFINFLFNTSDALSVVGLPSKFFVDASTAAVCVLALAFLFNFVVTVRLFTVHYEKNSHEFGPWWAKHRLGVAAVLLLCGLNPASFLILCSSTFNTDLCKGPVSLQAQKRFQVMGLISVLLVDVPFVCIQILAYIEVVSSSVLSWSGGASSVILGMCFSLVSITLGIVRRTCAVCIAKHPKAKLSQAEIHLHEKILEIVRLNRQTNECFCNSLNKFKPVSLSLLSFHSLSSRPATPTNSSTQLILLFFIFFYYFF